MKTLRKPDLSTSCTIVIGLGKARTEGKGMREDPVRQADVILPGDVSWHTISHRCL